MLKYMTAGESHGEALVAIVEGLPAGLAVTEDDINIELARRQKGFGRGLRMNIETDKVKIISGVRWGETTGAPVCMMIINADYKNNSKLMSKLKKDFDIDLVLSKPRPGHADLAGMLKFGRKDFRDILERASARETAARVSVGALAKKLLAELNITINSHVIQIGSVRAKKIEDFSAVPWDAVESSPLRCADKKTEQKMIAEIKKIIAAGDTIGGVFQIVAKGCLPGLGSHTESSSKLDARIAAGIMSIQAVKGVEFGGGFEFASKPGSKFHDEIFYSKKDGFYRKTNDAGGIEGGMTNGSDIILQAFMKPIASLSKRPLETVNVKNLSNDRAEIVRSDACAVPAAGVVGESVVAWELAKACKEKYGGDSMRELIANQKSYYQIIKKLDFFPL